MSWFTWLLNIEAPENMTLKSWSAGLRGVLSWGGVAVVVLVLLAFVGVSFLLYFRERGRLSAFPRVVMAVIRVGVLGFLLLLLLRPVLNLEFVGQRPRAIALLLDDTKSMQQIDKRQNDPADKMRIAIATGLVPPNTSVYETPALAQIDPKKLNDVSRMALSKAILSHEKLNLVETLEKQAPLRAFRFGSQYRSELLAAGDDDEVENKEAPQTLAEHLVAKLTCEQMKTALGDVIVKLISQPGTEKPAAIVVFTDGRNNAGNTLLLEAAEECRNAGVALHIYGVGSSTGGSLQLIDVANQGTIFYDDIVSAPIRWKAQGLKKPGKIQIRVMLGDEKVAEKELDVANGQDLRELLTFTPKKSLRAKYFGGDPKKSTIPLKVRIKLKNNPEFRDEIIKQVRLSDSKVRVLYIEKGPRWEFKFLQPQLSRDRRMKAEFLLVDGDPKLMKHAPFVPSFPKRDQLLKYDLIILGDVGKDYLNKDRRKLLAEYVREFRGGLVVIAGSHYNPRTFAGTELEEVLPVEFLPVQFNNDQTKRPIAFRPKRTLAGKMAQMLALSDKAKENDAIWRNLPGLYWHYPVTKLRPAAVALLVHPYKKIDNRPMPIMASQYYGTGQVLLLTTDETWRWRFNVEDKYYSRLWGQIIYQMALPHLLGDTSRRAQIALERSEALLNRQGYVYAFLRDRELKPITESEVTAVMELPGGRAPQKVTFKAIPGRPGEYRLFRKHSTPGRVHLRFNLPKHGLEESFSYVVKLPPRHELEEVGMAEEDLRKAAAISNGRFYREEDLHSLADSIEPQTSEFTLRQEILLWHPIMFVLFVGLIATEWTIRKFASLS